MKFTAFADNMLPVILRLPAEQGWYGSCFSIIIIEESHYSVKYLQKKFVRNGIWNKTIQTFCRCQADGMGCVKIVKSGYV